MEDAAISKLGDMAVNGTIVGGICDLSVPEPVFIPREDAVATTIAPIRVRMGMNAFFSRKQ